VQVFNIDGLIDPHRGLSSRRCMQVPIRPPTLWVFT
jgi:hypothetical protein